MMFRLPLQGGGAANCTRHFHHWFLKYSTDFCCRLWNPLSPWCGVGWSGRFGKHGAGPGRGRPGGNFMITPAGADAGGPFSRSPQAPVVWVGVLGESLRFFGAGLKAMGQRRQITTTGGQRNGQDGKEVEGV